MNFCKKNKHLETNNQTYFQHMKDAMFLSGNSLLASMAFFIHAAVPCSFEHTGSRIVNKIHNFIDIKNRKNNSMNTSTVF